MLRLYKILRFGWPYLRCYKRRFAAGILLAWVFAVSNGIVVGAIKTVLDRMSPTPAHTLVVNAPEQMPVSDPQPTPSTMFGKTRAWFKAREDAVSAALEPAKKSAQEVADRWLPLLGHRPDLRQIIGMLLLFPALSLFRGVSGYFSSYCLAWVSERVVNDLRIDVLRKLNSLSLDFFNRSTMGDLLMRVSGDTAALERCLGSGLSDLIKEPLTIIVVTVWLFFIDPTLTLIAVVFLPVMVLPVVYFGRRVRKAANAGLQTGIDQSSLLVEMLTGIRLVKAFNLEKPQMDRFIAQSRQLVNFAMRSVRAREIMNPVIEVVSTFGFGVVVLYILQRGITLSNMVTVLASVMLIYTPVKKLAGIHVLLQQTDAAVHRLLFIMAEQPTVREPVNPVSMPKFSQNIAVESLGFSYGDRPVLQDINLSLKRGQKLGIAGESGSGKSTLVNLLFRFYDPVSGAVKIDGINIRDVTTHDLRNQMAIVSQEIVLFDLTVAENIGLGRPGATREEIEAAAKAAFAHEFIVQMPHGYDSRIGERGVNLSGGQRQRLCIARAFVRNAPILVLDEATASLDSQAEAEVQASIERLEENRTVVCIAHRLSTLADMDRIVVLSKGRMVEEGTMRELIARNGLFADMARKQGITGSGQ